MSILHGVLLAVLAAPAAAASSTSAVTVESLIGYWAHPLYIQLLQSTHSQEEAERGFLKQAPHQPYFLSFERSEAGVRFDALFTFHEGDLGTCALRELRPASGGAKVVCDDGSDRGVVRFDDAAGSLIWSGRKPDSRGRGTYLRTGALGLSYTGVAALGGRYVDETGEEVELAPDGRVRWKGREYTYGISLDCVGGGCDELSFHPVGKGGRIMRWLYILKKDVIELWTIKEDENGFDQADALDHALRRR